MVEGRKCVAPALLLGLGLASGAAACEQILGIGGDVEVQASSSVACGLSLARGECQACLEQSCCPEAEACAKEPACAGYESCLAGCGADYACRARCRAAHPAADRPSIPALDTCAASQCQTACGIVCGAVSSAAEPATAAACEECLSDHVCETSEACGTSLACETVARCVESCRTADCQAACIDGTDAGAFFESAAYEGVAACLSVCSFGANWECVGHVSYPFAKGTITLTLSVADSDTHAALQGLSVKACGTGDTACSSALATGKSDAEGKAVLHFPSTGPDAYGFQGFLDIASTSDPASIVPYLYFFSFPLSEPNAAIDLVLLAPSTFENIVSLSKIALEPGRGHVAATADDCYLRGAPGVTFEAAGIDAKTTKAYLDGKYFSSAATATDLSGLVFFFNAPPVAVSLEATPIAIGRVSSRVSVFVRPGTISLVQAIPTP